MDKFTTLLWVFTTFGLSMLITMSHILAPLRGHFYTRDFKSEKLTLFYRKIGELLHCPMCTGFWVSGVIGHLWYSPTSSFFLDACLGSGTTFTMYALLWAVALKDEKI
tara:strand:+ start:63 stop:386 length:324 start_codon:yes stop_codon:yes gene_type:complete